MNYQNILTENQEGIAIITVNRPDSLNALNYLTIQEIGKAVKAAEANSSIGGIIITGSGSKSFVAGADIKELLALSTEEAKKLAADGHRVFDAIEACSKPVIAAVNGFCLGGGCELAMSCHLRIASENAKFGQPEVNLGLTPGYGGTQRLIRLIGRSKGLELLLTADMLAAGEAHRLGLVNYVVSQEDLLAKCKEILQKINTKSPNAVAGCIACANAFEKEDVNGFTFEIDTFGACFGSPDFIEGTAAFIEKRKATFKRN